MRIKAKHIALLLILLPYTANAGGSECKRQGLGWHFYCDPKKDKDDTAEVPLYGSAQEEIAKIRAELDEKKALAVLSPTRENIYNYIAVQNRQIERAEKFAKGWQRVLWEHPELDYSVHSPNSTIGNKVLQEVKNEKIKQALSTLSNRYGIFFFYMGDCIYCRQYSQILKSFAQIYSLDVMPIAMDGKILPEWPSSILDNGESTAMGMLGKPVPATLLFDDKLQKVIPIGFGILSISELEERIYLLTEMGAE